jgi:hypothetical protein
LLCNNASLSVPQDFVSLSPPNDLVANDSNQKDGKCEEFSRQPRKNERGFTAVCRSGTPNRRVNIKVDAQPKYEMEKGENPY